MVLNLIVYVLCWLYHPDLITLGKVVSAFFNNYVCEGVKEDEIDIYNEECGKSVFGFKFSTRCV